MHAIVLWIGRGRWLVEVFGFGSHHTTLTFKRLLFSCKRKGEKMKNIYEIGLTMQKILAKLEAIDAKVNGLPPVQIQVSNRFLPTFVALTKLGCGTASQMSRITGRARAFESKTLNEMQAMGLLSKKRSGKSQVFYPRHPNVFSPTLKEI